MLNKLFRGLFISLFALTLSACVGAVNIGGTSPQDTLINRCIVGNTAQSDPTCAKAVADTNGCITNPFLSGCEANPLFSPYVQNARDERVKFCNDANNEADSLCTGSDSEKDICTHDPFGRVCNRNYSYERAVIVEHCIEGINANDKRCKSAIITYPCIANPFAEGCNADSIAITHPCPLAFALIGGCDGNNDSGEYFATAQNNRIKFCNDNADAENNVCPQIVRDCLLNPFNESCRDSSFKNTRESRITFCSNNENSANNLCTAVNSCHINPFGTGCFTDAIHDASRKQRISFCGRRANKDNGICAVALSRPNVASFLQSFDEYLRDSIPFNSYRNEFLQGTATGVLAGSQGSAILNTLNLETGDGSQDLGGDATDGIFMRSKFSSANYYAGIFSGTDLGAPVSEPSGTSAEWNGRFRVIFGRGSIASINKDFTLTINFGAGDQAGTISASFPASAYNSYPSHKSFSLTGNFGSNGVFKGGVSFGSSPGILRGLIGQEGAVGVFISNNDEIGNEAYYAGGFVVVPPNE